MEEINELIEVRRKKREALLAAGLDPYGGRFERSETIAEARRWAEQAGDPLPENHGVTLAGRIMTSRTMGRIIFCDLRDQSGKIQLFAQNQALPQPPWDFEQFANLDLGDFIGVCGTLFKTKAGELTVKLESWILLAKALRPLPEKWHGLKDTETRYRQRYLDLIANESVRDIFLKRSRIITEIRKFLDGRGFVEVETPMMQMIAGGAAAEPFITRHKALGLDLFLRIAPELYLKRLLVGGFEKVYEINRNFRNEGISRKHNPEFTMLEAYQAYGDYETMMELVESLVATVAQNVCGTLEIKRPDGGIINLKRPWRRVSYENILREKLGDDILQPKSYIDRLGILAAKRPKFQLDELRKIVTSQLQPEEWEFHKICFEKLVEPTLLDPTFVTHLPAEIVPLAKLNPQNPKVLDVFECIINGVEIAPAYSEQNDPIVQRERLEHQIGAEKQKLDEDFLLALEHGMPPAGGMGLGIDRLVMMLTGQENIRDVILFPLLRPQ